jgi:AcrR family transcriptional regulator
MSESSPLERGAPPRGRRSVAEARDTRAAILRHAVDVGSIDGLEGLTIGRLAADLGMSKAGVIGQFGTKEGLQLASLDLAADMFRAAVWAPAEHAEPGLPRLLAICAAWARYAEDPPFAGGCFMAGVSHEFDAREGRVHEALGEVLTTWRRTLVRDVRIAVEQGDLPAETDPEDIAFALDALASGITPARRLVGDEATADRCLRAMLLVLGRPAGTRAAAPA